MAGNPFGIGAMGRERFGDEVVNGTLPRYSALGLSYSIAGSMFSAAMGLSYTIQAPRVGILQLYYLIAAPIAFAINGDSTIIAPDQVTYTPRGVYARDLLASPLFGGYATLTWTYTMLQQPEAMHLLSFYDPTNPVVTLVYPDDDGIWVQRQATMLPPNYGTWETIQVEGLVLSFLLLSS